LCTVPHCAKLCVPGDVGLCAKCAVGLGESRGREAAI
jgi:hypothetical protein